MKRLLHLVIFLFFSFNLLAQAPNKMTYQAVIRNASNNLVVNAPVKMKISILQGSENGTEIYSELHNPKTNENGLVTIQIGGGTSPVGSFGDINWGNSTYFLKTETDPSNGTNYSIVGTSQLLSVPYALHSNKALTADSSLYALKALSASKSDSSNYALKADSSTNAYNAKTSGDGIKGVSMSGDTLFLNNGDKYIIPGIIKVGDAPTTGNQYEYNFSAGAEGWIGDFADYPTDPAQIPKYELEFTHTVLPDPLNTSDGALKQSGINRSDDLFMFIKKKITGLEPGRNYTVDLKVDFASNAADNMVGVGGAPGEGVTIKAGAVSIEPIKIANTIENYYRMNIDKSNQSQSGMDMKVIGNFANGTDLNVYKIKQLSTSTPLNVKANQQGEIWLVIGTDSGFESRTTIYYNSIQATIK